ncbi:TonB-dependent receptor domain-containing protein [Candidatus Latescibacterota bacterium]
MYHKIVFHAILMMWHARMVRSGLALIAVLTLISMEPIRAETPADTGTLAGVVTDRANAAPIYGGTVSLLGETRGAVTNERGEYEITGIPPGLYNVRFVMIGYQTLVRTNVVISPGRVAELSVQLEVEPIIMETVTVTATESYFDEDPEAEVSGRTIDAQEIINSSGGLMDIQRVVQVLPSVVSGSDQYNEIIVRGGNYGENLFVMDGIEIPNPNHFALQGVGGGPISLLRAEFISEVSFIAGAFPAKYGDKASSVMDITLRSGNRSKLMTNLDMGMAGLGVIAEGPVAENGSFLFSARKSYLDLIVSSYGITAVPHYHNLQGKLTYRLGDNHTLLWNTVYGSDGIRIKPGEEDEEEDEDYNVDEASRLVISGLTLKSVLSRNLYSEMVLSHVRNRWESDVWDRGVTRGDALYGNRSTESETTLKYDLTRLWGNHELSGGFSVKNSRFDHDIFAEGDTVFVYDTSFTSAEEDTILGIAQNGAGSDLIYRPWRDDRNVDTLKSAVYGQVRLNPIPRLILRLGGRYDYLAYTKNGNFAPRVGIRYRLTETFSVNGAFGVHYQSPSYITLTAHKDNKDLESYFTRQYVLGTEWLPRPDTRMTVEVYSKRYRDVPVALSMTTTDPWDSSEGRIINAARGHSEGIELYLHRKMSSSYMYILSYSFYRAFFDDPRTGEERPWDFDHRHVFTASAAKRWSMTDMQWYQDLKTRWWYRFVGWALPFGDEVLLSAKWRFVGGRPYTEPLYLRSNHVWIIPGDERFNTGRLPDYHRLDIRLDRRYYFKNWSLVVYLDVMNVYNRKNVWDYNRDEYGKRESIHQFTTFPVGGFNVEF